jgi:hypothetical protein
MTTRRDDEPFQLATSPASAEPRGHQRTRRKPDHPPPTGRITQERLIQPAGAGVPWDDESYRLVDLPAELWGFRKVLRELGIDLSQYDRLMAAGRLPQPIMELNHRLYWTPAAIRHYREGSPTGEVDVTLHGQQLE